MMTATRGHSPYDARTIANLILDFAQNQSVALTQMKLHKLLYFAHGWYLHQFAKPLVWNQFEAWQHGPVVKALHDCFKDLADTPIAGRAVAFDFSTGQMTSFDEEVVDLDRLFVEAVVKEYLGLSAIELSDLTHEHGSPWDQLWNCPQPIGRFGLRIRNEEIKRSFDDAALDARRG